MFKFLKKLFENNEPEVMKHLCKLSKSKPYIIDNFKFGYDDMRRLSTIHLVDGYDLNDLIQKIYAEVDGENEYIIDEIDKILEE